MSTKYPQYTINNTDYEVVESDNNSWCWTSDEGEGLNFSSPLEALQGAIDYEMKKIADISHDDFIERERYAS